MTFAWPHLFWLLLVPAGLLAWELTHRRRVAASSTHPKILQAEAGAHSLKLSPFATSAAATRQVRPRIWLCIGLALAIVALARPQWGRIEEPVFDQSREILLAIDLSRSMLAPDVRPSRLERAKLLIQSLLEKLAGERVGLVVFAGTAFLQSPLSADYEILREFLPALDPDFLPEGGSNYGALINTALDAFSSSGSADRFLIVLSDGEATDEEWRARLGELSKRGIRVIGLGVGTTGGAMIPDGSGGFVKDERGAVVLSKLENATLQELARATNGVYRDASAWIDLAGLVQETVAAGRKGAFVEKNTVRLVERFQWPLALALWCLMVSYYYEFPVRPRVRDLRLSPEGAKSKSPPKAAGAPTASTAAALALLFALGALLVATESFAAATLAQPQPKGGAAAAPEPPPLAKIVGRLAAADTRTGRDWAELARETVTWGSRLKSEQQQVPEGPVRDALQAVEIGSKLDPKTTDWKKLREELQALLEKPEEQQQQDQQEQPQDQQQNQKDQKDQKQKQDNSQKKDQQQQSDSTQDPSDQQQQQDQQQKNQPPSEPKPQGESAFGDMNQKEAPPPPPPPPSSDTQKVGGQEKDQLPEQADPALALPLQKLEQLKNQDSPALLFQMMEGERKQPPKKGKDW